MTVPSGQEEPRTSPTQWAEDLAWHRHVYNGSKYRWTSSDAVLVATEFTRGRDVFATVDDLRELAGFRLDLSDYATTCQRAFGEALKDAQRQLGLHGWNELARLLDVDAIDCAQSAYFHTWADVRDPAQVSNPAVRFIRQLCDGFYFASPLLLAWEMKQMWRLHQAAENVLEDTLVDLVEELRPAVDDTLLADACHMMTISGLHDRITVQRNDRGPAGDPRRIPTQIF